METGLYRINPDKVYAAGAASVHRVNKRSTSFIEIITLAGRSTCVHFHEVGGNANPNLPFLNFTCFPACRFYRVMLCIALTMPRNMSVRLSVRPSVTRRCFVETAEHINFFHRRINRVATPF